MRAIVTVVCLCDCLLVKGAKCAEMDEPVEMSSGFWTRGPKKVNCVLHVCGAQILTRHGTGSLGHLGHLSRPGHRVIILTRCETGVFPVFEKKPKIKIKKDIFL